MLFQGDRSSRRAKPSRITSEPLVATQTALACLGRLGTQHGVHVDLAAVRRRSDLDSETLPLSGNCRIAAEFGLQGQRGRLDWRSLFDKPLAGPVILALDNGNTVGLVGLKRGEGEDTKPDHVAISDPLFRLGDVFFLDRPTLERSWSGASLLLQRAEPATAKEFGFGWFTARLTAEPAAWRRS